MIESSAFLGSSQEKSSALLFKGIQGTLLLIIFSLPFHHLLVISRIGFVVLLCLLLAWCVSHRNHLFLPSPIGAPLIAFIVWVGITLPFATFPEYSGKEFGKLLQQGCYFFVILYFFKIASARNILINVVLAAAGIMGLFGIYEFCGMIGLIAYQEPPILLDSLMSAEVWLNTYLIMVIPLSGAMAYYSTDMRTKWFSGSVAILSTVCLLLTFSRAGILVGLIEFGLFSVIVKRKVFVWGMIGLAIGAGLLAGALYWGKTQQVSQKKPELTYLMYKISTLSIVHRLDIWQFVMSKLGERPLVGMGYGKENFKLVYGGEPEGTPPPGHFPVKNSGTHNMYLELIWGVGIPGFILFIWVLGRIIREAIKQFSQAREPMEKAVSLGVGVMVVGFSIRLLFDQMLIGSIAILFWILVAILCTFSKWSPNDPNRLGLE